MAGLYDGLEELAFKRVTGGYLFVSSHPWFFGPARRYLVTEAEKAKIAECLRQTLQRIKPFALATAVLMPLVLVAAVLWLSFTGCRLTVILIDEKGQSSTYTQPIGPDGAIGTLDAASGATVTFKVSGPPGEGATVTFIGVGRNGKASTPSIAPFGPGGAKICFADASGHIVGSATLVGRTGATRRTVTLYAMLLALAMFVPYVGLMHVYRMHRLRPLIAGLRRSDERFSLRERMESFAGKAPFKLIALLGACSAMGFLGAAMSFAGALLANRSVPNPLLVLPVMAATALMTGYIGYLILLRTKLRRKAG